VAARVVLVAENVIINCVMLLAIHLLEGRRALQYYCFYKENILLKYLLFVLKLNGLSQ